MLSFTPLIVIICISAANSALATEQERHRHAKEELTKARNALQFVKTQALVR